MLHGMLRRHRYAHLLWRLQLGEQVLDVLRHVQVGSPLVGELVLPVAELLLGAAAVPVPPSHRRQPHLRMLRLALPEGVVM
mmetsp:Transcript_5345/g.14605  ORF Transcript_5345/g.14605 Transcript_5345/m.14605 type:complete len:81 (-) Transcript_5345:366-608(-)